MDRREYADDGEEAIRAALDGRQATIWTALAGEIQSFDATKQTAVVQPTTQVSQTMKDGSVKFVTLPLLLDCPTQFPGSGGVTLTFPVAEGDECLVVFASRCIDAWWQNGGVQAPAEVRMHDLSDGFVLLGFRAKPNVIGNISTSVSQLRSDDGKTFVELDPAGQVVTITAPGGLTINAEVTVNGNLSTVNADVIAHGTHVHTHTHSGVTTGGGNTGAPN